MSAANKDATQYRPCVGVMLINGDGQAFVGKRIDTKEGDWWQMPQGGVDEGEDLREAAYRELHEETGVRREHVEFVAETENELFYDLPPELHGKLWGGKYRGQRQTWYCARFLGTDGTSTSRRIRIPNFPNGAGSTGPRCPS